LGGPVPSIQLNDFCKSICKKEIGLVNNLDLIWY
jgi:hypothetical protein